MKIEIENHIIRKELESSIENVNGGTKSITINFDLEESFLHKDDVGSLINYIITAGEKINKK